LNGVHKHKHSPAELPRRRLRGKPEKDRRRWASQDHLTHLVVFPELALTGYPPQDLLHSIGFLKECKKKLEDLIDFSKRLNSLAVVGMPYYEGDLYNSLVLIGRGRLLGLSQDLFAQLFSL
jgi:NAD+ synthase (glutamine-hydrolysing)